MRSLLTVSAVLALFCTAVVPAAAQDTVPAAEPAQKTIAAADAPTPAQLRAQMHRTMAALIEAQSAETPNQEQIDDLTRQLRSLREQTLAKRPVAPASRPGNWRCPWGGPGYGPGPGMGYGRGPGMGYGPGPGMGYGRGPAWGGQHGPARGRGAGQGPGYGRGLGPQWAYTDKDGDGVCDNYQAVSGQK